MDHLSEKSIETLDSETEDENSRKVEAALFIAGKFMTIQELITLTDVNPIFLKKILADLQDKYKNSGINIVQKDNFWKMDVAPDYIEIVNKLATGSSEFSRAEQETLAMIAYKQPIKQSVVIKIRGNKAYDHIKKFVELGLLSKKKIGHTSELALTDAFHDYFHVNPPNQGSENGNNN
jgi:segregation and condensation protein B